MALARAVATAALAALWSAAAGAQAGRQPARCSTLDLATRNRDLNIITEAGVTTATASGRVTFRCQVEKLTLVSDSVQHREGPGLDEYVFVGRVEYTSPDAQINSDTLTYYRDTERLLAKGNVDGKLANGSSIRGPIVDYLREIPGKQVMHAKADRRPHVSFPEGNDSTAKNVAPTVVDADIVEMFGNAIVTAFGKAIVTRADFIANADSITIFRQQEVAHLTGNPSISGTGSQPYVVFGSIIELTSRDRKLQRVQSFGAPARANGKDFTLNSDTLDLRMINNQQLEQAYAFGTSGAHAVSADHWMNADSLDIRMPGQRLHEVHAVGRALVSSRPDTTRIKRVGTDTLEHDRLWGDTVVAMFAPVSARDSTPKLRALTSRGSARSYYHTPSKGGARGAPPTVNYCLGSAINVRMESTQSPVVTIQPPASGPVPCVLAEPLTASDSGATKIPASGVRPPPS
jgi:lipopolysaccharide export system protein LptA